MSSGLLYIQIGTATPIDVEFTYNFHLKESSNINSFERKDAFTQEFPEEHGERYFPSTKYKACDYFITLGYYLEKTAENDCIPYSNYDMNTFITSLQDSQITIYNNLKKNKIVGYLKSVETIKIEREKYSSLKDLCEVKLTFRINNPDPLLCNLIYVES